MPGLSAAVTLSTEFVVPGQPVQATLAITNLLSTDVVVLEIRPTVTPPSAAVTLGACAFGGPVSAILPAGVWDTKFYFNVVAHAPQAAGEAGELSWECDIGATVLTSDGSITAASPTILTVSSFIE